MSEPHLPARPAGWRRLIVMRHAKSDWSAALPDIARPLSGRGLVDAPAAGQWLAARLDRPDAAVVSVAERTRQTWDLVCSAAGWTVPTAYEPAVYGAYYDELAAVVGQLPDEAWTAMLVGHSPGSEELVRWAVGEQGAELMPLKFATAAVAVIEWPGDWSDLDEDRAALIAAHVPRG